MDANYFSGKLKQQCLDDDGMYEWTEKMFILKIKEGLLEMYPSSKEESPSPTPLPSLLSLVGAKMAKEWTVASQSMGFGFDIIWLSGNVWSFLADDQMNCHKWVANINESILSSSSILTKSHEDLRPLLFLGKQIELSPQLLLPPPPPSSSSAAIIEHLNESDTTINEDFQSPAHLIARGGTGESGNEEGGHTVPRFVGETKPTTVAVVNAGVGIGMTTPFDDHNRRERVKPSVDVPSSSAYRASANIAASHLSSCAAMELEALRLRVKQLSDTVDEERSHVDMARKEVTQLQADLDASNLALVKHTEMMRQKERDDFQAFHNDMHVKIAKAVNDRDSLHEAALRSAEEPLKREIMHLREELTEERKRFGEKVSHESRLRDAAEGREGELQRECARLRDAHSRLTRDLARATDTAQSDAAAWTKEREALIASAEERISSLEIERDHIGSRSQADIRGKIKELTERFQQSSYEAQKQIRLTVEQEMLAERVRALGSMEQQCAKDVAKARADERLHAERELESTKRSFIDREAHTTRDLIELEKLHDARVKRLESQLAQAKKRAAEGRDQVDVLNRQMSVDAHNSKSIHSKYYQELEGNAHRADQLTAELQATQLDLQETRVREAAYRDQLGRVLEDARVKNAELLESQRQASDGNAQALHWRRAVAATDTTHAQTTTKLQIARDEIALLEHELRRVKTENMSLLTTLDKTERLVYKTNGVVNASGATHTHPGKENTHPQVTHPYRYSWEKETDAAMRNTWHSSNHTSSNYSNHNTYSPNSELLLGYNEQQHPNHHPHHHQQQHVIASTGSNTTRGRPPSFGANRQLHRANAMATLATRGTVSSNARAMSVSSLHATQTLI